MAKSRSYDREFKFQAARLVVNEGYSQAQAAERLGVSANSIGNWVNLFRESGELVENQKTTQKAEELRNLRKENRQLRLENEILKKAAAYFAKESM